jgi:hypothetical protein
MTLMDELRMPFPVQASLLTGWKMDMQESVALGNTCTSSVDQTSLGYLMQTKGWPRGVDGHWQPAKQAVSGACMNLSPNASGLTAVIIVP